MRIYTSNFDNLDRIITSNKVAVAICRKCPPNYEGLKIPELALTHMILHEYHKMEIKNCIPKGISKYYLS